MNNKFGLLHISIDDDGYHLLSNSGEANYTLNGNPTSKVGAVDNLPDKLVITDRRSLPSPINASAKPTLWGAKVEWKWPNEANGSWYATFRCEYSDGDKTTYQAGRAKFPDCIHQIAGVPAGKDISLTIRLYDENGRSSEPVPLSTKSSDDAGAILRGLFTGSNGQALIKDALSEHMAEYTDEIVGRISAFIESSPDHRHSDAPSLAREIRMLMVAAAQFAVSRQIKEELRPGGLLHGR